MTDPSLSFGSVAAAYDRGRPGYPREAVEWLLGPTPVSVLELGAGTGKLTELMVSLGHDVFATDPDDKMLDILSERLPDVRATVGTAEQIPAPDSSADVVIVAQAFHWFDLDKALPEIVRVLRPGGRLALIWNHFDTRIPWVKRLQATLSEPPSTEGAARSVKAADDSGLFSAIDDTTFKHWQTINQESIFDLANSRSKISTLPEDERNARLAAAKALYDEYDRGMDGMQLPYMTHCYRMIALAKNYISTSSPVAHSPASSMTDTSTASTLPPIATGDDSGIILIDFN